MKAITREEKIMSGENLTPITREEMFLAKAAGMDVEIPQPITRKEIFLSKIGGSGGGASAVISPLEVTENGTYTAGDGVDGYSPITVNVAGSGGPSVEMKDINFYDYDGTRLYSYTLDEFADMTELPPLPSRDGLICQEWNWTLEDIKAEGKETDVGATYITDDGATRLYIEIAAYGRMDVPLYFKQTITNGVTIDWGDGSAKETVEGTGFINTVHTYANVGEYMISLMPDDGCVLDLGNGLSTGNCSVLGSASISNVGRIYCNMLRRVEVGNGVTSISKFAFTGCSSLTSITFPNVLTSIGQHVFENCYSLVNVTFPKGVTSVNDYTFNYCYSLISVILPKETMSLRSSAFEYCQALTRITLPKGMNSIKSRALRSCFSLTSVTLPDSLTSLERQAIHQCYSISSITLPKGLTSIGIYAISVCYCLSSIIVPNSVTTIVANTFNDCPGMKFYDFTSHTSVPTLEETSAFQNIPADCEIRVPAALYDEWIAATNWTTYADKIVAV